MCVPRRSSRLAKSSPVDSALGSTTASPDLRATFPARPGEEQDERNEELAATAEEGVEGEQGPPVADLLLTHLGMALRMAPVNLAVVGYESWPRQWMSSNHGDVEEYCDLKFAGCAHDAASNVPDATKAFRKRKEVSAREAVESISFRTMEDWTGRWHKRHLLALDTALRL